MHRNHVISFWKALYIFVYKLRYGPISQLSRQIFLRTTKDLWEKKVPQEVLSNVGSNYIGLPLIFCKQLHKNDSVKYFSLSRGLCHLKLEINKLVFLTLMVYYVWDGIVYIFPTIFITNYCFTQPGIVFFSIYFLRLIHKN